MVLAFRKAVSTQSDAIRMTAAPRIRSTAAPRARRALSVLANARGLRISADPGKHIDLVDDALTDDLIRTVLKDLLQRRGRELIDEVGRCEEQESKRYDPDT